MLSNTSFKLPTDRQAAAHHELLEFPSRLMRAPPHSPHASYSASRGGASRVLITDSVPRVSCIKSLDRRFRASGLEHQES
jgi:hypothetical protein